MTEAELQIMEAVRNLYNICSKNGRTFFVVVDIADNHLCTANAGQIFELRDMVNALTRSKPKFADIIADGKPALFPKQ